MCFALRLCPLGDSAFENVGWQANGLVPEQSFVTIGEED
jgi:hypothetical protein